MNKKISFEKKQTFPTMIGEISAISLERDLKFQDSSNIAGYLILSGKYKMTEASRLEEEFKYQFPIEISLSEKIDINTSKIDITDFYYEIENNDTIICHIELEVSGEEIKEEDVLSEERECDGEVLEKEIEIPIIEEEDIIKEDEIISKFQDNKSLVEETTVEETPTKKIDVEEVVEKEENKTQDDSSFFINLADDKDTYGTFIVYLVSQNESLNSIIEKYNTSVEELEKYNQLDNIIAGTKLIIPYSNE